MLSFPELFWQPEYFVVPYDGPVSDQVLSLHSSHHILLLPGALIMQQSHLSPLTHLIRTLLGFSK